MDDSESWQDARDTLEDQDERRVLFASLDSFSQFRRTAHFNVTHRRRVNFYALPSSHQKILCEPPFSLLNKLDLVDDAIDANAEIASRIYLTGLKIFGITSNADGTEASCKDFATKRDIDKARSTIRQFYREWSADGAAERESCYGVVLKDLTELFGSGSEIQSIKVLIPGAGLGRLAFEVCRLGFDVEGNEISFHQLVASHWILNVVQQDEKFDLYPSIFAFSNQLTLGHQLKKVQIPDVHPGAELALSSADKVSHAFARMAMTAADFTILYSGENYRQTFDVVATVFFIDTAPNVIRYIETIHNTLKEGGVWINIGPLLWHFEPMKSEKDSTRPGAANDIDDNVGIGEPGSFEMTNQELLQLVEYMGFVIEHKEVQAVGKGYTQDEDSMLQTAYRNSHFIARKR